MSQPQNNAFLSGEKGDVQDKASIPYVPKYVLRLASLAPRTPQKKTRIVWKLPALVEGLHEEGWISLSPTAHVISME